jgi:uncharacterized protein YbjQ (UPF0145 family)
MAKTCNRCGRDLVMKEELYCEECRLIVRQEFIDKKDNTTSPTRRKVDFPDLIVTTTNSIEGKEIEKYIDIISDRIVVGAGLFSEFFAGFTDVFGGRSEKFESRMHELYRDLMISMKTQADAMHADAIVGLKIDMDEISGKNLQMFMISGTGTAVKLKDRIVPQ